MNLERQTLKRIKPQCYPQKKKPTNIRLIEIMNTIQDFKPKFSKEVETLKIPIIQIENSKESFTNRMNQAEYRILRPENKVRDLIGAGKENIFLNTGKEQIESLGYHKNSKTLNHKNR